MVKSRPELKGIYALTDPALTPGEALYQAVEQALRGGVALVQYRDKSASGAERHERARKLLEICRDYAKPLIINDDVEVARASGAAGVHLGAADTSLAQARRVLGPRAIIGISCYNRLESGVAMAGAGADYVAFGSAYPSPTKPEAVHAPLSLYRRAKSALAAPVCAIGGIDADNAAALLACGVDMLAVISGIFAQKDIESAARRLVACVQAAQPHSSID
ncbi:MAG TPA: thiamine phosphate synthase [Gammaproteobacteria bacterium]|nr:thiamine phosphate synthase [Gammaproteobacteria bacterium]